MRQCGGMVRQSGKPRKGGMDVQIALCKWACTKLGCEMDLGGYMGLSKMKTKLDYKKNLNIQDKY